MVRICTSFTCEPELDRKAKEFCNRYGISKSHLINLLLKDFLGDPQKNYKDLQDRLYD